MINRRVAELLEKLRIELTKSCSRHCNDNTLAESKNAAVVRKILGYCHIPQKFAPHVNRFNQEHLVPYVNYHRPCFFPEIITDTKDRQKKRYRYENMMTPYEELKSLPDAKQFLKPGLTFQSLDDIAYAISDNEAAKRLQEARHQLFESIDELFTCRLIQTHPSDSSSDWNRLIPGSGKSQKTTLLNSSM